MSRMVKYKILYKLFVFIRRNYITLRYIALISVNIGSPARKKCERSFITVLVLYPVSFM